MHFPFGGGGGGGGAYLVTHKGISVERLLQEVQLPVEVQQVVREFDVDKSRVGESVLALAPLDPTCVVVGSNGLSKQDICLSTQKGKIILTRAARQPQGTDS